MFFGQRYFSCDDSILCLIFVFCLTVMRIVWCPVFGVQLFKKSVALIDGHRHFAMIK